MHHWYHEHGIQHLKLLKNGNLLIHSKPAAEGDGSEKIGGSSEWLIELDWHSNEVFKYRDPSMHHDYCELDNGNFLYIAREPLPEAINDKIKGGHHHEEDPKTMWGDTIKEITRQGEVIRVWRSWEFLDVDQDIMCPLESRKEWTHANSLSLLPSGDWLVSFRLTDTIAIIDAKSGEFKWKWGANQLSHQHHPSMLENGNILVFDNGPHRKRMPAFSRVLEVNPNNNEIVWTHHGKVILSFFSFMISGCERMPNGNTVITEGATGRIFEVTHDHEIVWEYISPWTLNGQFGPTPAVFRSYRFELDDPRFKGKVLSANTYAKLNQAVHNGEVQIDEKYFT